LSTYIVIFTVIIDNIGSHLFPQLKAFIAFKNFSSFGTYAQVIFDGINKALTTHRYTFCPFIFWESISTGRSFRQGDQEFRCGEEQLQGVRSADSPRENGEGLASEMIFL